MQYDRRGAEAEPVGKTSLYARATGYIQGAPGLFLAILILLVLTVAWYVYRFGVVWPGSAKKGAKGGSGAAAKGAARAKYSAPPPRRPRARSPEPAGSDSEDGHAEPEDDAGSEIEDLVREIDNA